MAISFKITKLRRSLLRILCKKPHKTVHALTKIWLMIPATQERTQGQVRPYLRVSITIISLKFFDFSTLPPSELYQEKKMRFCEAGIMLRPEDAGAPAFGQC